MEFPYGVVSDEEKVRERETKYLLCFVDMTFLYSWWSSSNVTVYVDPNDLKALQREYAIILVNHRYDIDWLLGLVVAQEIGLLGVSLLFSFFGKCSSLS